MCLENSFIMLQFMDASEGHYNAKGSSGDMLLPHKRTFRSPSQWYEEIFSEGDKQFTSKGEKYSGIIFLWDNTLETFAFATMHTVKGWPLDAHL